MESTSRRLVIVLLVLMSLGVTATFLAVVLLRPGADTPTGTKASQGRALYNAHCAVCHGPSGKGDGPGVRLVRQPMRDFSDAGAMRAVDDAFLTEMIKKGSSQFGRSNAMPAWGMKFSDEEIRALVAYIRLLASRKPPVPSARKETP